MLVPVLVAVVTVVASLLGRPLGGCSCRFLFHGVLALRRFSPVVADGQVVAVAAGGNHSLALTKEGRVFQWGQRTFLQPQEVTHGYVAAAKTSKEEEAAAAAGAGDAEEDEEDPKAGNGIRIKAVAVRGRACLHVPGVPRPAGLRCGAAVPLFPPAPVPSTAPPLPSPRLASLACAGRRG